MAAGKEGFQERSSLTVGSLDTFRSWRAFCYLRIHIRQPSTLPRHKMLCRTLFINISYCSSVLPYHMLYVLHILAYYSQQPEMDAFLPTLYVRRQRHRLRYPSAFTLPAYRRAEFCACSPAPNQAFNHYGQSRDITCPNISPIFLGFTEIISHQHQWPNTLSKNTCLKIQIWC